jgi:Flp pilus assembly pilin Flp
MFRLLTNFTKDENGAVTVDWVVLTAAVVALAVAVVVVLVQGSAGVSAGVEAFMTNWEF